MLLDWAMTPVKRQLQGPVRGEAFVVDPARVSVGGTTIFDVGVALPSSTTPERVEAARLIRLVDLGDRTVSHVLGLGVLVVVRVEGRAMAMARIRPVLASMR